MPPVKNSRPSLEVQERDLAIFRALFESRLLTLNHIKDLYFKGSYEAAKKGIQRLKAAGYLRDRGVHRSRDRGVYEPSLLYLTKRSFDELSRGGRLADYPHFTWKQLEKRIDVSPLTIPAHHPTRNRGLEHQDVSLLCTRPHSWGGTHGLPDLAAPLRV